MDPMGYRTIRNHGQSVNALPLLTFLLGPTGSPQLFTYTQKESKRAGFAPQIAPAIRALFSRESQKSSLHQKICSVGATQTISNTHI